MQPSYHFIIAEDEASIRALIARIVVRTYPAVTISAVDTGMDALMVYAQRGADLLITDNNMPSLSGIDLVQTLRARNVTIPIVMVAGNGNVETRAMAVGVTRFIEKPFYIQQLMQVLTALLPPA